jgi:hypothetical protein
VRIDDLVKTSHRRTHAPAPRPPVRARCVQGRRSGARWKGPRRESCGAVHDRRPGRAPCGCGSARSDGAGDTLPVPRRSADDGELRHPRRRPEFMSIKLALQERQRFADAYVDGAHGLRAAAEHGSERDASAVVPLYQEELFRALVAHRHQLARIPRPQPRHGQGLAGSGRTSVRSAPSRLVWRPSSGAFWRISSCTTPSERAIRGGGVGFRQYFGSALQVTPRLHVLVPDGMLTAPGCMGRGAAAGRRGRGAHPASGGEGTCEGLRGGGRGGAPGRAGRARVCRCGSSGSCATGAARRREWVGGASRCGPSPAQACRIWDTASRQPSSGGSEAMVCANTASPERSLLALASTSKSSSELPCFTRRRASPAIRSASLR